MDGVTTAVIAITILALLIVTGGVSWILGCLLAEYHESRRDRLRHGRELDELYERNRRDRRRYGREMDELYERNRRRYDELHRRQVRDIDWMLQRVRAVDKCPNPYYEVLHPRKQDDDDPSTAQQPPTAAHGTA